MNPKADRLYEIAATQAGYFTAQQAVEPGYRYTNHPYYANTGIWAREWRGIYRLAHFPEPDDGQYALWSLWSRNRTGRIQGVYSHETALRHVAFDRFLARVFSSDLQCLIVKGGYVLNSDWTERVLPRTLIVHLPDRRG